MARSSGGSGGVALGLAALGLGLLWARDTGRRAARIKWLKRAAEHAFRDYGALVPQLRLYLRHAHGAYPQLGTVDNKGFITFGVDAVHDQAARLGVSDRTLLVFVWFLIGHEFAHVTRGVSTASCEVLQANELYADSRAAWLLAQRKVPEADIVAAVQMLGDSIGCSHPRLAKRLRVVRDAVWRFSIGLELPDDYRGW